MLTLNFGVAADGDCEDARDLESWGPGVANLASSGFGKVVSIVASILTAVGYPNLNASIDGYPAFMY